MVSTLDCDVLIVGAGPTGVSLALLLAQHEVRVIVVDKEPVIYPLPRAAHVDHEAMRVFQSIGVANDIMATSRSAERYDFLNARGEVLLRFENANRQGPGGWPAGNMIHQPSVEQALRSRIAQTEHVALRTGWRFESYQEDPDSISAEFTTPSGSAAITARYLVGCDGTRSPVREAAGIALHDLQFDEPWLVIDTMVLDSSRLPTANLQICNPERPTTCVVMGEGRHRWEFMIKPGEHPESLLDDTTVWQLLEPWHVHGAVTIERKAVYRFNARIAKQWRRGRLLLAGDAAHQMPPFAGQGMCSGIRDAANLAWKLSAVVKGGPDSLLDAYQPEREPNVRAIIDMAIMMGRTVCITDPAAAAARDQQMLAARAAGKPPSNTPTYSPIAQGIILNDSAAAGQYFPQPVVDSTRLDDLLGNGPWLIHRSDKITNTAPTVREVDVKNPVITAFGPWLNDWLDRHRSDAVLVRPDRYVFGTGLPQVLLEAWRTSTGPRVTTA